MAITKASSNAVAPAAKGDLVVGSATNDSGVLAVGSTDQVLTVDSTTATGLKWATPAAGGMTLLSTTTLSGATTTISSISGSYNTLFGIVTGMTNATGNGQYRIAPNGSTTTSFNIHVGNAVTPTWQSTTASYLMISTGGGEAPDRTSASNAIAFTINNYTSTTAHKPFQVYGYYNVSNSASDQAFTCFGGIQTTSAITSLVFSNDGGNLSTGTVLLYGVK